MNGLYFAAIAFIISLLIGHLLIPSIVFVSMKRRLFDAPNSRKLHTRQISRLGGISFLPSAVIGFCLTVFIMNILVPRDLYFLITTYLPNIALLISGLVIVFLMGIIDDLSGMMYRHKFVLQTVAALIIVAPLMYVKNLYGILGIWDLTPWLSIPLTTVGVVLLVNAYNLIDGVDGLCSGLAIVALTTMSIALFNDQEYLIVVLSASLIGVLSAFFCYNVFGKRLKIFMGDTGSLILGYMIAYVALQHVEVSFTGGLPVNPYALALGSVFVPLFDATRLFVFRMIKGVSPFTADNNHIHHKFIAIGFSHIKTTFYILGIQIGYILLNLLLSNYVNINLIIFADICIGLLINFRLNILISKRKRSRCK